MTEQERINVELQRQVDETNARIDKFGLKLDHFGKELSDFKAEMRDRDNQRAAEMSEIRTTLQNMQSNGRTMQIATLIGIAAMVVAILLK